MTEDEPAKPVMPQTLGEAHEALARIRPARQAPLAEWLAYHQRSAALYAKSPRSIEDTTTTASIGQTANMSARGRSKASSPRVMTNQTNGMSCGEHRR